MSGFLMIAKALSDESRLRILKSLGAGELCMSEVTEILGLAPSTVSKHLHLLAKAGLVTARQQGRWRYYRLAESDGSLCARRAIKWFRESVADDLKLADAGAGSGRVHRVTQPRKVAGGV
jgi:DNA-binding transcriptional ArsR family regulator